MVTPAVHSRVLPLESLCTSYSFGLPGHTFGESQDVDRDIRAKDKAAFGCSKAYVPPAVAVAYLEVEPSFPLSYL